MSLRLLLTAAILAGAMVSDGAAQSAPPAEPIVIAAKLDAEGFSQLLVPVEIGGGSFWCNLDSGGSWVLSLDTAKALAAGLKPNASGTIAGVGPDVRRDERVTGVTIALGPVVRHDVTVVLGPRPGIAPDIDCVLGLGLFEDFVVEFDYLAPRVRLFTPGAFTPPASATAIPFQIDRFRNPYLTVPLTLTGTEVVGANLMVDTGASYYSAVLMKPFVAAHQVSDRVPRVVSVLANTPGLSIAATRLSRLQLGPFQIDEPVVALIGSDAAGIIHDGLLGAGFLRRFTTTFDYTRRQLWLEPNDRLRERQRFDASGLSLVPRESGGYLVAAVAAESAAARAGVREGDELVAVGGREVMGLTLGDITAELMRADTACVIQVRRGGETHSLTLALAERL